ncbi:Hypothetical predicted protein [Scomber scombrus]|uniref:Uncharacterized protein n=1 Tax=Scomber scombrus TaxID=13677 RepID=A0AAV1P4X9_SCOSC
MSEKKEEKNMTTTTAAGHKLHVCICGWKKVDLNKRGRRDDNTDRNCSMHQEATWNAGEHQVGLDETQAVLRHLRSKGGA